MPELPEVETIKNGLKEPLTDEIIDYVILRRDNLRYPFPDNFGDRLEGRKIIDVTRRAKYLLIILDNNSILVIHLGMSGKLTLADNIDEEFKKHDHVIIALKNGKALIYNDARRFGLMDIVDNKELETHKYFAQLAPEPLTDKFTSDILYNSLSSKKIPIKNAIMDNKIVVGVGNIYACESLFRSGISPTKESNSLNKKDIDLLIYNIKNVLQEAIISGGSTLRDYVQATGEMGYFQHKFNVYGRENEPCYICTESIKRIKQQGRSTFFCPKCQR